MWPQRFLVARSTTSPTKLYCGNPIKRIGRSSRVGDEDLTIRYSVIGLALKSIPVISSSVLIPMVPDLDLGFSHADGIDDLDRGSGHGYVVTGETPGSDAGCNYPGAKVSKFQTTFAVTLGSSTASSMVSTIAVCVVDILQPLLPRAVNEIDRNVQSVVGMVLIIEYLVDRE